tara:strand:+ start:7531 stop:8280 length:750 start_codon:yes stop_codon:yes gene_type:complete
MAFKMRSGNRTTFKDMGSSPNKQQMDNTQIGTTLTTYTHHPTEINVPPTDPIQDSGSAPVSTSAPGGSSAPDSLRFGSVTPPPPGDINYPDSSEETKKKKNKEKKKKESTIKDENKKKFVDDKKKIEKENEKTTKKTIGSQKKDKKRNYDDEYVPQSTFGPGENPNVGRKEGRYSHESRDMIPETQKGKKVKKGNGDNKKLSLSDIKEKANKGKEKKLSLSDIKEKVNKGKGGKNGENIFEKIKEKTEK